jgi:L-ascorbate metabolism protein UlaG (beta-lactamase superfamily)
MNIKKLGHCCLLITHKNKTFITDPGAWTTYPETLSGIDYVIITHEHADHFHVPALLVIVEQNPNVKIVCNKSVGKLVNDAGFEFIELSDGMNIDLESISLEGFGTRHGEIWNEIGQVENTGFFLDNKLFYPGDNFTNPNKQIDILAAPVYGPWMTVRTAIEYILLLKPKKVFPVHDAMITQGRGGRIYTLIPEICGPEGIEYVDMKEGDEKEF